MSKCKMVSDGHEVFVVFNGVKIAKRGPVATSHTGQWISLEPGYVVRDTADLTAIEVEINGVRLQ
jgi:hypothetical protein